LNYPAASSGVSQKTLIMVAASGGESNPSGRRQKHAIFCCDRAILSHLLAPPRLKPLLISTPAMSYDLQRSGTRSGIACAAENIKKKEASKNETSF
jgi:hypothetical protein